MKFSTTDCASFLIFLYWLTAISGIVGCKLHPHTPRKEVIHGSCKEAGLEEDHQERGQEARGQEGQVGPVATVSRLEESAPALRRGHSFGSVASIPTLSNALKIAACPMKHIDTTKKQGLFKPLIESASVQAAMMVLKPGESSSDKLEDEHPKSEQWLFVVSGVGRARTGRRSLRVKTGSLLLIEKRERHQITNTGDEPMVTINFYAPPAYLPSGDVKRSVKR